MDGVGEEESHGGARLLFILLAVFAYFRITDAMGGLVSYKYI